MDIVCSHISHPANSAYEGWDDGVLGTTDGTAGGYICPGCALYDNPPIEPEPE